MSSGKKRIFFVMTIAMLGAGALLFSCLKSDPLPKLLPPHGGLLKIPVTRDQVYDLSGYADEGDGNPFGLFDENAFVDPRYPGPGTAFAPVSGCRPRAHSDIYFGPHGNRIVVDLGRNYSLHEIWAYDRSSEPDSVWFNTGTMRKWNPVAELTGVGSAHRNGWKKIAINRTTRFLQIAFRSLKTDITEMVLYGEQATEAVSAQSAAAANAGAANASAANADMPLSIARLSENKFTTRPLNQFLGVNYIMESDPRWLKPFHYSRIYNFALDYDDDTVHQGTAVQFNMLHYGLYDEARRKYVFQIDTLQQVNDGSIWYSVRGVSRWMSNLGFGDKDRPVDRPGLDPELTVSYTRHARMMWNLAAFFGYNLADSNLMSLSHSPKLSGRRSMNLFENGNEEDAWWEGKKYADPVSIFAQSSADWDGDEGRLGPGTGIHGADSAARLMMSGLIGLDTNRVKVYRFLCDQLRNDHRFVWNGGVQYHHYANRYDRGISPEEDSLRSTLTVVRKTTRRIAPGADCVLGEIGYDKTQQSSHATPLLPGYDPARSQAIMLMRTINATFFSGFDACILYWLKDGEIVDDPRTYQSSGLLKNLGNGKTMAFPSWYQISGMVNVLGKYVPDSIVSEQGDVWIYRYRNISRPDSVALFVYCPTVTGKRIDNFSLPAGLIRGPVTAVDLSDSSDIPVYKKLTDAAKSHVEIAEKPTIFLGLR